MFSCEGLFIPFPPTKADIFFVGGGEERQKVTPIQVTVKASSMCVEGEDIIPWSSGGALYTGFSVGATNCEYILTLTSEYDTVHLCTASLNNFHANKKEVVSSGQFCPEL